MHERDIAYQYNSVSLSRRFYVLKRGVEKTYIERTESNINTCAISISWRNDTCSDIYVYVDSNSCFPVYSGLAGIYTVYYTYRLHQINLQSRCSHSQKNQSVSFKPTAHRTILPHSHYTYTYEKIPNKKKNIFPETTRNRYDPTPHKRRNRCRTARVQRAARNATLYTYIHVCTPQSAAAGAHATQAPCVERWRSAALQRPLQFARGGPSRSTDSRLSGLSCGLCLCIVCLCFE